MRVPKLQRDEVLLKNGQIWKCHPKSVCASNVTPCVFHSPTNHVMSLLPLETRYDKAFRYDPDNPDEAFPGSGILLLMLERRCEHGVGHPDPDCVAWLKSVRPSEYWGVHGCCAHSCCFDPNSGPARRASEV